MSNTVGGYQFFAIIDEGKSRSIKRIVASQGLEREMGLLFDEQATEFLDDKIRRIPFDPRYTADYDDLFEIKVYALTDALKLALNSSAQVADLDLSADETQSIKSIFASRDSPEAAEVRLLFQKFNKARLLRPGWFTLMHRGGTFQRLQEPGLTLDTHLVAAYVGGSLLFRTYSTVAAFLDLTTYFVEATNEDIAAIFSHPSVIVEDEDSLIAMCDSHVRKSLSIIKLSKILDTAAPRSIVSLARDWDMTISLRTKGGVDQFVLPHTKKELKRFLGFLCERYFKGTLTQERYEANSIRRIQ